MKKQIFVAFIISNIISFGAGYYVSNNNKDGDVLEVEYVEGEEIVHRDFKQTKKELTFTTVAKGKGKIKTRIQKNKIPEFREWGRKNLSDVTILPVWNGSNFRMVYQANYKRRLTRAYIGCSVLYSPRFTTEKKDIIGVGASIGITY